MAKDSIQPMNQTGTFSDLESRVRQLEAERDAAVARADAAESRVGTLESEGSERRYSGDKPVISATRNKPTWPFKVHCAAIPKLPANSFPHPKVPDEVIEAVDESEAIRQFCLMRKDEKDRQLDPTRYQFQATCLKDNERQQRIINRLNNRRAVAAGKLDVLTREEEFRAPEQNAKAQGKRLSLAS